MQSDEKSLPASPTAPQGRIGASNRTLPPSSLHSNLLEKALEHQFLGDLCQEFLRRGQYDFEILRGEVDAFGHDLIIEVGGVMRHIQLKAMRADGARRDVDLNLRLRSRRSACAVWMLYNPESFKIAGYRLFAGKPGEPIPDLGDRPTRHSKPNSNGVKTIRPALRRIPKSRFEFAPDAASLLDLMFGTMEPRNNQSP